MGGFNYLVYDGVVVFFCSKIDWWWGIFFVVEYVGEIL